MNHETFFENLELLADAPNGVQKLREMILLLAFQGKLVPQDSGDESAAVLLEKINLEKYRLLREKKIKNQKQLPLIEPEKLPFDLPKSWKWVRLGEVVNYNGALKVSPNNIPDDSWLLELEDIEKDTSKIIKRVLFRVRKSKSTKTKFENGDVLYGKLRPYLNKVVIADEEGFCTTEIIPLHGYFGIFPKYLMYSLKRPDFLKYVNSKTYGINLPRLGTEDARSTLFPLAPLEEQKRIVAKVEQIMALCDQLEARQQKKHEQRIRLNNAALDKLLTAPTPQEFAQHWQRIWDNFDLLYDAPETVGQLRQAILQLAVQGKLVAQDQGDEPAAVLLEKIKGENERLVKKSKVFIPIKEEIVPFVLPNYWEWTRLGEIAEITMGNSPPGNTYNENGEGVPLINGPVEFSKGPFGLTKKLKFTTKPTKFCEEADLLICVRGSTTGRTNVAGFKACIGRGVAAIRSKVYQPYINYFILSMRQQIYDLGTGSTFPSISQKHLVSFLVPLPPFEEQKRIVAKVDQLMILCDELEAGLVQAQTEGGKLMEAVVHHVLAG